MNKNTGGAAFPVKGVTALGFEIITEPGLSVHDYFAGQALAGMCANPAVDMTVDLEGMHEVYSKHSYKMADAMLKARDEQ